MDTGSGSVPVVIYADLPLWHRLCEMIRTSRKSGRKVLEIAVSSDIADVLIMGLQFDDSSYEVASVELEQTPLKVIHGDESEVVRMLGWGDDSIDLHFPLDFQCDS